jgi:TatD DNase family protein
MNIPQAGDFIDIHVHGGTSAAGIFILESLMAHERKEPGNDKGIAYTYGIHPWFLNEENHTDQLEEVKRVSLHPNVIAIGEAGFDKLRGPSPELQRDIFERQAQISEELRKPLIIHCVRSWEELIASHRKIKPSLPWMIHGFRGKAQLAEQLISKGFYLSIWFEFVLRPESAELLRATPLNRLFLETDGADVDIKDIYSKVSADLGISTEKLKASLFSNFLEFFKTAHNTK